MAPLSQPLVDAALALPGLDPAAKALKGAVDASFDATGAAKQPLKDALNGTWLGHALHPAVTDVPIGAWTAALVLDLYGERRAARIAVGVGLVGAFGAATTGLADWVETHNDRPRKLGVVHAALNGTATLLYAASWFARPTAHAAGVALAALGYGIAGLSALYGGTISLDLQVGTNYAHATNPPPDWTDVAAFSDVPDGGMIRVDADRYAVLLARRGVEVNAIGAVCAHQGGPLEQGTLDGDIVTCPWHNSRFCVRDGSAVNGPTAYPQPAFKVNVTGGRVLIAAEQPL